MVSVISFDLDMTLLDHNTFKIPESALEAIDKLRRNNYIVIASGRDMSQDMSKKYIDIVKPDAIIHLNGSRVESKNNIIFEHFFDKKILSDLLKYAKSKDFCIGTSVDNIQYFTNHKKVEKLSEYMGDNNELVLKNADELLDMNIYTVSMFGESKEMDAIEKDFPNLKFPRFHNSIGCDILENTISKAKGLSKYLDTINKDMNNVIAFGDSLNDYEILKEAGIGIAMGNAHEKLKNIADYVTLDISDNGIWNACKFYKLF